MLKIIGNLEFTGTLVHAGRLNQPDMDSWERAYAIPENKLEPWVWRLDEDQVISCVEYDAGNTHYSKIPAKAGWYVHKAGRGSAAAHPIYYLCDRIYDTVNKLYSAYEVYRQDKYVVIDQDTKKRMCPDQPYYEAASEMDAYNKASFEKGGSSTQYGIDRAEL